MKTVRNLHPAWIAGIIAISVALWLASGLLNRPDASLSADETKASPAPRLINVQVKTSRAQPMEREVIVNGNTAPVRSVRVKAETTGRVAEVAASRGSIIQKGGVIIRLAMDDRQAQLRQSEAVLKQRRIQYQAAQRLHKQDYMTEVDLAQAEANLEIVKAEVEKIQQDINHTVIRAPFTGILESRSVEVGDFISPGDEIGYVIEQDPFIVSGSVPEDIVGYLAIGQTGSVTLSNGQSRQGRVRYLAAEADEATRTFLVELEVGNPQGRLISGASAKMRLPLENVTAHELEPATLTLDENGDFGIKSVDAGNIVQFHKANIIRNQDGKVWLAGLPESVRVITVGQGFVNAGDRVSVVAGAQAQKAE